MSQLSTTADISGATEGTGTGTRPFGVTECLHLAATPTFAVMALLTGVVSGGSADMLCPAGHGMSPLGGMAVMYLLMSAFHSASWLKLISSLRRGARRPGQTR
jgi:hypothetical protein